MAVEAPSRSLTDPADAPPLRVSPRESLHRLQRKWSHRCRELDSIEQNVALKLPWLCQHIYKSDSCHLHLSPGVGVCVADGWSQQPHLARSGWTRGPGGAAHQYQYQCLQQVKAAVSTHTSSWVAAEEHPLHGALTTTSRANQSQHQQPACLRRAHTVLLELMLFLFGCHIYFT